MNAFFEIVEHCRLGNSESSGSFFLDFKSRIRSSDHVAVLGSTGLHMHACRHARADCRERHPILAQSHIRNANLSRLVSLLKCKHRHLRFFLLFFPLVKSNLLFFLWSSLTHYYCAAFVVFPPLKSTNA
jgi:hypothetical protein